MVDNLYGTPHRGYGDTFATGHAFVHNGNNLHFHNATYLLQDEVQTISASIEYPGMHDRYEHLKEATDGTYEWIHNPTILETGEIQENDESILRKREQMAEFLLWYGSSAGLFWINGKPGSGKSTLMKYLVENLASTNLTPDRPEVIVLSFFFWVGGGDLSRSKDGCLRSLLWQLLQKPTTQSIAVQNCSSNDRGTWTSSRLQDSLLKTLKQLDRSVVVFIDGLDEGNEHDALLELIDALIAVRKTKICISSRPEAVFATSLEALPRLVLQDLNAFDIQTFVRKSLLENRRIASLRSTANVQFEKDLEELAYQIRSRSEGVFLWVHLVVKDLLKGMRNRDNLQMLLRRLERLPRDIADLYENMLQRSQDDADLYREEAALYFALALHKDFKVLEFCFAIDYQLRQKYLQPSHHWSCAKAGSDIDCDMTKAWIIARTAGLLDVVRDPSQRLIYDYQTSELPSSANQSVIFIHRTAIDFLTTTIAGNSVLDVSRNTHDKISKICFQTSLICQVILPKLHGTPIGYQNFELEVFTCDSCTDDVVYAEMRADGLEYLQSIPPGKIIDPDPDCISMIGIGSGHHCDRSAMFPTSQFANLDLAPIFILAGRLEAAKWWLIEYGCLRDKQYMSTLLLPLLLTVLRRTVRRQECTKTFKMLEWFIEQGADVHESIILSTGERVSLTSKIGHTLSIPLFNDLNNGDFTLKDHLSSLNCTLKDLTTNSTPGCDSCHDIWWNYYCPENEHYCELWGSFCPLSCTDMGLAGDTVSGFHTEVYRSGDDRVLVLALAHDYVGLAKLWALSETDSRFVIELFRSVSLDDKPCKTWSGKLGIHSTHDLNENDSLRNRLHELCETLPAVSFAGAMLHMGKTPRVIELFYEKEAKRMVFEPPEVQERWKEWYWGSDVPVS